MSSVTKNSLIRQLNRYLQLISSSDSCYQSQKFCTSSSTATTSCAVLLRQHNGVRPLLHHRLDEVSLMLMKNMGGLGGDNKMNLSPSVTLTHSYIHLLLRAVFYVSGLAIGIKFLNETSNMKQKIKEAIDQLEQVTKCAAVQQTDVCLEEVTVTFDDVKGMDDAKDQLTHIIAYLHDSEKFTAVGAKLPKGAECIWPGVHLELKSSDRKYFRLVRIRVLLIGPNGIGKSLLARAVAGEAGVPCFHIKPSEFQAADMFANRSEKIRQLFEVAKTRAPCVVYIDAIDSLNEGDNSVVRLHSDNAVKQLITEMTRSEQNIVVFGTTSNLSQVDQALRQPGCFDLEVQVKAPDLKGRREILEHFLSTVKVGPDVDIDRIARGMWGGYTAVHLRNLVNVAAFRAAMEGCAFVTMAHMEFAVCKVSLGHPKKGKIQDPEVSAVTAFHEAGHALMTFYTKDATPLNKVTIVPNTFCMGFTSCVHDKEQYYTTKAQLLAYMDVYMGGRVAEELTFGANKITTGSTYDLQSATNVAISIVKQFGMSDKFGVCIYNQELGNAAEIDTEIRQLLQQSYSRARAIIDAHRLELKLIADALLQKETLDVNDIKAIIASVPAASAASPASDEKPTEAPSATVKQPTEDQPVEVPAVEPVVVTQ